MANASLKWTATTSGNVTGALGDSVVANNAGVYTINQVLNAPGPSNGTATYLIVPSYRYTMEDGSILFVKGPAATATLTVVPKPVLSSLPNPAPVCSGTSFNYTATSNVVGATFNWSRAAVNGISNPAANGTGATINETLVNTTTTPVEVIYVITITAGGCSNSQEVKVSIVPTPTLSSSLTALVCSGSPVNYTTTSNVADTYFKWTRAAVAGISNAAASGTSGVINETLINTTTSPINVIYVFTLNANNCETVQNVTITVNPTPVLNSTLNPRSICNGTLFQYTPTSAVAGATITWTRDAILGISNPAASGTGSISEVLTDTVKIPGTAIYKITSTANGCSVTRNDTVRVNPTINVTQVNNITVCNGASTSLISFTGNALNTAYLWTNNTPGIGLAASGTGNITSFTAVNNGSAPVVATITVTPTAFNCTGTAMTFNITVNPTPVITSVTATPTNPLAGESVDLSVTASGATDFQWYKDGTAVPGATNSTYTIPSFSASDEGGYTVQVTSNGCSANSYPPVILGSSTELVTWKTVVNDNGNNPVLAADILTYTINIRNLGTTTLSGLTVTDYIPEHTTFVQGSATGGTGVTLNVDAGNGRSYLTYTLADIASGASDETVSFKVSVNNDLNGVSRIANMAKVTGPGIDRPTCPVINPNCAGDSTYIDAVGIAKLQVVKSVSPGNVNVGDIVTFKLSVTNTGSKDSTNVNIRDLPYGFTYISDNGGGAYDSSVKLWRTGGVAINQTKELEIQMRANPTGPYYNVMVGGTLTPDNPTNPIDTAKVTAIRVSKSANKSNVNPGDTVTFSLSVYNEGTKDTTGVQVTDIPTGFIYLSDNGSGTYDGSTGVWNVGSVPAGGVPKILQVEMIAAANGPYSNLIVGGNGDPSNPQNPKDTVLLPAIRISKIANKSNINIGDTVMFTISVQNVGAKDTTAVLIKDIATGFSYLNDNGSGSYDETQGIWTVNNLAAGAQAQTLNLTMIANATGPYSNIIVGGDGDPANPSNPKDTVLLPALRISKLANKTNVRVGDTVLFTLSAVNAGAKDTTNVVIKDIPQGFTYLSDNGNGSYNSTTGEWNISTLVAGAAAQTLQLSMRANAVGPYINSIVGGDGDPGNPENPKDTVTFTSLLLSKVANKNNAQPNDTINFTIKISNVGSKDTTAVHITDIPEGLTYISDNGNGTYNNVANIWSIDTLKAGAEKTLVVSMKVADKGPYQNIVVGGNGDPANPENPQDTAKLAALRLSKTADKNNVNSGDQVVFTISVHNEGSKDTTGVSIKELPEGFTYISDDGGGSYNSTTGIWLVGDVLAGATPKTIHITMQANASGPYKNLVVGGNGNPADPDNPVDSVNLAAVRITKVANKRNINPGDTVVFTIKVDNIGSKDTANVVVKDLPTGFTYITDDAGTYYDELNNLWTTSAIVGTSSVLNLTMRANATGPYSNIVVGGDGDPTNPENPQDTVLFTAIRLTKSANKSNVNPGDEVVFTLSIRNEGSKDTSNVVVTDLPQGFTYVSDNGGGSYNASTAQWTVNNLLAGGAAQTLQLTARANASGPYSNIVVGGDGDPTNPENPQDTVLFTAIRLTKAANKSNVNPGDEVVFTLSIRNEGSKDTSNVVVTDLPQGFTYVSDNGGGSYNASTAQWTVNNLLAGGAAQTLQLTMRANLVGPYSNIIVGGNGDPGNPENPQDTVLLKSFVAWKLVADSSANNQAEPDERLTYTIRIRNTSGVTI